MSIRGKGRISRKVKDIAYYFIHYTHKHTQTFNYIWITSTLQRIPRENTIPISSLLFGAIFHSLVDGWQTDGRDLYVFTYQGVEEVNFSEN